MSYGEISPAGDPEDCWVLLSYRAGENTQLRGLASALSPSPRYLKLDYRGGLFGLYNLAQRSGTGAINPCPELRAPWPRLLISAGLRNEPVARWVRSASGGHTRIVFLGRTWANARHFDLVVTTPQYRLPNAPTVAHNPITLHGLTDEALQAARHRWAPVFERFAKPRTAVLIGGRSGPFHFGPNAAATLVAHLRSPAETGSLMVTTSSRTPMAGANALAASLNGLPHHLHRWRPDDPDNPYLGMLAWADRIVVTSDSVAMVSEALFPGVPVQVFDVGTHGDQTIGTRTYRTLQALGPQRLSRDTDLFHQNLIRRELISWTDEALPAAPPKAFTSEVIQATVERVRDLYGRT